jgi:hypothetical protein
MASGKLISLEYPGWCAACGTALAARTRAWWDSAADAVICSSCPPDGAVAAAVDGPAIGALRLAASESSPASGGDAREALSARLDACVRPGVHVLHDRRAPGTSAAIDHLVVFADRVYVVAGTTGAGAARARNVGRLRRRSRLFVGSRDRTALVATAWRWADAVRGAVEVPVLPVVCVTGARWRRSAAPFLLDGALVTWPHDLAARLGSRDGADPGRAAELARVLAHRFPPADSSVRDLSADESPHGPR